MYVRTYVCNRIHACMHPLFLWLHFMLFFACMHVCIPVYMFTVCISIKSRIKKMTQGSVFFFNCYISCCTWNVTTTKRRATAYINTYIHVYIMLLFFRWNGFSIRRESRINISTQTPMIQFSQFDSDCEYPSSYHNSTQTANIQLSLQYLW